MAQEPTEAEEAATEEEAEAAAQEEFVENVVVTGSRIYKNPLDEPAPVLELTVDDLTNTGLTNLGETLEKLPVMGSGINTTFNVPGNSGFPQDGTGIGAGAVQLSLRNLGTKRTLVLVDGKRWVAGASASGVPNAVDMNTIPANVIERVEILQDGASAIYGSDAIGGVINIITRRDFNGFRTDVQTGSYSEGDGDRTNLGVLWGGGNDSSRLLFSLSYTDEGGIETWDRAISAYPSPYGKSCADGGCSSFTPQGRFVLGPEYDYWDGTLNDGVLNDGGASIPVFDPNNPDAGDFHSFSTLDRFNYNGPGYNFLQTPNERVNIFATATHDFTESFRFVGRGSYTNRQSRTMAAPEPLCFGAGCGNRIAENIVIDADQIYNPFGVDLSVADGTLEFFGRRPLESGGRIFDQDVNTYFVSAGFEGLVGHERAFFWDVTASYGDNRGFQQKHGAHNMARLAVALGDPSVCAATPGCVPFNLFGGQGPTGVGSITQEMLDYVGYVQRDFSEQTLLDLSGNITGELFSMPGGAAGFAAGFEYREHDGSFQPDPIAERGETAGIASGATQGSFDVSELYGELNLPLVRNVPGADLLEVSLAGRYSDYSTFGSEPTYKLGALWRPIADISVRGSVSTGLRAPGIGELFGGAAREDFTFLDPCADVLGQFGSANGGRDAPQPQNIIDNCAALGVPVTFTQRNPQLSAVNAGNESLIAETSDSYSFGVVYSPAFAKSASWSDSMTFSLDFNDIQVDDAIQGRDPGEVISACVDTLDPFFCDAIDRAGSGLINLVDNQLQNIGAIETSGFDFGFRWRGPRSNIGRFDVQLDATYLSDYTETTFNPDGSLSANDRTGTITNETFQRAFPEWRATTGVGWELNRWTGLMTFRFVDSMIQESGNTLSSVVFTDLQLGYVLPFYGDSTTVTFGGRNIFDEDPPTCDSCGVIGFAPVIHDIPGTVLYARLAFKVD